MRYSGFLVILSVYSNQCGAKRDISQAHSHTLSPMSTDVLDLLFDDWSPAHSFEQLRASWDQLRGREAKTTQPEVLPDPPQTSLESDAQFTLYAMPGNDASSRTAESNSSFVQMAKESDAQFTLYAMPGNSSESDASSDILSSRTAESNSSFVQMSKGEVVIKPFLMYRESLFKTADVHQGSSSHHAYRYWTRADYEGVYKVKLQYGGTFEEGIKGTRDLAKDMTISPWHDIPYVAMGEGDTKLLHFVCEIPKFSAKKFEITTKDEILLTNPKVEKKKMDLKDDFNPIMQDRKAKNLPELRSYKYTPSADDALFSSYKQHLEKHSDAQILWNYGAIAQTYEDPSYIHRTGFKGDADPIDVVQLNDKPCTTGDVQVVRVLGVFALIDDGETDWKLLVVDVNAADTRKTWTKLEQVPLQEQKAIIQWFRMYKTAEGKDVNKFWPVDWTVEDDSKPEPKATGKEWKVDDTTVKELMKDAKFAMEVADVSHDDWCKLQGTNVDEAYCLKNDLYKFREEYTSTGITGECFTWVSNTLDKPYKGQEVFVSLRLGQPLFTGLTGQDLTKAKSGFLNHCNRGIIDSQGRVSAIGEKACKEYAESDNNYEDFWKFCGEVYRAKGGAKGGDINKEKGKQGKGGNTEEENEKPKKKKEEEKKNKKKEETGGESPAQEKKESKKSGAASVQKVLLGTFGMIASSLAQSLF